MVVPGPTTYVTQKWGGISEIGVARKVDGWGPFPSRPCKRHQGTRNVLQWIKVFASQASSSSCCRGRAGSCSWTTCRRAGCNSECEACVDCRITRPCLPDSMGKITLVVTIMEIARIALEAYHPLERAPSFHHDCAHYKLASKMSQLIN